MVAGLLDNLKPLQRAFVYYATSPVHSNSRPSRTLLSPHSIAYLPPLSALLMLPCLKTGTNSMTPAQVSCQATVATAAADGPCTTNSSSTRYAAPKQQATETARVEPQMQPGATVRMNNFLQLSPAYLETAFWASPAAVKLLKAFDLICLTNAVFTSFMLICTFGTGANSGMSWHYQLPMLLYGVMNVTQLSLLLLKPNMHQAYRFQLTLISRSLRLVGLAWCSYHTAGSDMARMLGSVKNKHRATTGKFLNLMRSLIVPPMAVFNHANFVLPFAFVLPAQIWTFATCSWMMRTSTCIVAQQAENLQLSQQACGVLRNAMYNLGMLLGGPPQGAAANAVQECGGLQGVVLLGLYLHVLLLVVVPCLAVYLIELNMKLSFIKTHALSLEHTWPIMESKLIKVVMGYGAVVGGWMACEVAVLTIAPLQCTDAGLLTWAMTFPPS